MMALLNSWKGRHLLSLVITGILIAAFGYIRSEWSSMHQWNRAFADASFLIVAIVLILGPLSRLFRPVSRLLPWRRELGVWSFVAGLIHAGFILFGWVELEWQRLFGFQLHPQLLQYVMVEKGFGLGNIIGFFALMYGLALSVILGVIGIPTKVLTDLAK